MFGFLFLARILITGKEDTLMENFIAMTMHRHFHNGNEKNVAESEINSKPEEAIKEVLGFFRKVVITHGGKELVVEPLGQGHRVTDGNKTGLITYPVNGRNR